MRRAAVAVTAALLVAACHHDTGGVTLDADEDARNATAARITADLQAADQAAARPLATPRAAPHAAADEADADGTPANSADSDD